MTKKKPAHTEPVRSEKPRPFQMKHWVLAVLLSLAVGILVYLVKFGTLGLPAEATPSPNGSQSPTPASVAKPPTCLREADVAAQTGRPMELQREEFFEFEKILECSYTSTEPNQGFLTLVSYTYHLSNEAKMWESKQYVLSKRPNYKVLENYTNLYLTINPVYELSQASFYLKNESEFVELSYSSHRVSENDLIEKGRILSEKVLQK